MIGRWIGAYEWERKIVRRALCTFGRRHTQAFTEGGEFVELLGQSHTGEQGIVSAKHQQLISLFSHWNGGARNGTVVRTQCKAMTRPIEVCWQSKRIARDLLERRLR